jgi:hypothetical protein
MIVEIAITKTPTVLEAQAGGQEQLVLDYTTVVAANANAALVRLGVEHAEQLKASTKNADQWQIRLRQS